MQYFEKEIDSVETLLDIPITSAKQAKAIPLRNIARLRRDFVPTEITHNNLQSTIDLTMGVYGRDLGHVAADVARMVDRFGVPSARAESGFLMIRRIIRPRRRVIKGATIELSGEYSRMQDTFRSLGFGLILATLLIYFLMAALFKSYVTPLVILFAVPLGLFGVVMMLYLTDTAINVQSLLGVIFMVGIVVSNTVLLIDFAQTLAGGRRVDAGPGDSQGGLDPRPSGGDDGAGGVFRAGADGAGMGRGSEANAPLGRAVIGGILAGLVTTLFVGPCPLFAGRPRFRRRGKCTGRAGINSFVVRRRN